MARSKQLSTCQDSRREGEDRLAVGACVRYVSPGKFSPAWLTMSRLPKAAHWRYIGRARQTSRFVAVVSPKYLMIPAVTYDDVCQDVKLSTGTEAKLVGLLFARPELPLAKSEITPSLNYFHFRSGAHTNFYCAGYTAYGGTVDGYKTFGVDGWIYSDMRFNAFRWEIQDLSSWRYSGDCDLLLTNAYYNSSAQRISLDFSGAIVCRLDAMKKLGAILSVSSFFESIFQYAEHADGTDPIWGFSNSQGRGEAISALKRFVLSLLPKELGKDVEKAAHFAVVDISPRIHHSIRPQLGLFPQ
jgi:hypothetical protein